VCSDKSGCGASLRLDGWDARPHTSFLLPSLLRSEESAFLGFVAKSRFLTG